MNKDKALETAMCARINLDNLGDSVLGLKQTVFFKIVDMQIEEVIKNLKDGDDNCFTSGERALSVRLDCSIKGDAHPLTHINNRNQSLVGKELEQ